ELSPGLHWRWPQPFERVLRKRVDLVRSVQIGFRAPRPAAQAPDDVAALPIEWTSEHADENYQPRPDESLVVTGDEVAVEITADVQFRIADLERYLLENAAPDEALRSIAEGVIRETAAALPLEGLLTDRRSETERRCLETIRERTRDAALGVEVVDLNLLDLHPPRSVVAAYRDVADMLEERERLINDAEAEYAQALLSAAGERVIRRLSAPEAPAGDSHAGGTTGNRSNWTLDDAAWKELSRFTGERGDERFVHLAGDAAATLLQAREERTRSIEEATGAASRFRSLLAAWRSRPALTGLALYWQAMEDTLASRPLTIVDPDVAGRQHVLLADPLDLGGGALLAPALGNEHEPPEAAAPMGN
ncbi:MAG: protease modulator HflK, partial [Planctomycetes bacterium]|nr:protease modulator HflK [Planctomycetota bacterium]